MEKHGRILCKIKQNPLQNQAEAFALHSSYTIFAANKSKNLRMKALTKMLVLAMCLAILPFSWMHAKNGEEKSVYVFGYGESFRDSTVYLSAITSLPASVLAPKTKFLTNRNEYGAQLKRYVESTGSPHATCAVFFFTNKKKAEKKYAKLRRQLQHDAQRHFTEIPRESFSFTLIQPSTQE